LGGDQSSTSENWERTRASNSDGRIRKEMKCPSMKVGLIVWMSDATPRLSAPNSRSNSFCGLGRELAKKNQMTRSNAAGAPMSMISHLRVTRPITNTTTPISTARTMMAMNGDIRRYA
jgi:hypothetical protein